VTATYRLQFLDEPTAHGATVLIETNVVAGVVVQTLEVEPIRDLEVTTYHAASTAFQISGAVLFLTRSWPSLN
jgi:hypothetical protein